MSTSLVAIPGASSAAERSTRRGRGVGLALGTLLGIGVQGSLGAVLAQGVAPAVGTNVQLGDLRRTFQRAYEGQPAIGTRSWTVTPSIDLQQTFTDNARGLGTSDRSGSELITTLTPGIVIQGDTARLRGTLGYAPQLSAYANSPRQNGIAQNLFANGRATIFENLLFLNATAYAAEQSRNGGLGTTANNNVSRNDRVQTTSFSIGPLLQYRFGDIGMAEAGYTYSHLTQTGRTVAQDTPFAPALSNRPTTTKAAHVGFTSGQEFGRLNFGVLARRINYDGTGVLKNAHRNSEVVDLGYAVSRTVTLVGEIGHEDIRYGGITPVRINGLLWSVGVRWNPDPDTRITVRYGRRDGGNSVSFDGITAPTARTRLAGRYSEGVSTGAEDLQNAIAGADLDAFGAPVDRATGTPLVLANNFGGAQGGVSRVRRASLSATLLQEIDVFSLSLQRDERRLLSANTPAAAGTAGAASATTSLNAILAWQRELAPGLRGNAAVSYGVRSAGGGFALTQETLTFSTGVTYAFSETLSARSTYSYTSSSSNRAGFSYAMNLVTIGVHKSF